jgi:hypothetical protein
MSATPKLLVQEMCGRLAEIERETLEQLGETKGGFFVNVPVPKEAGAAVQPER